MLPVNYGNFLRKSDVKKSSYEIMKPHISKYVNCFTAFALGTFLVAAGFFINERFIKSPLVVHDEGLYKEYQSLNSRISKNAALLRESRPAGINAIDALEKIATYLFEKETITGKQFMEIYNEVKNPKVETEEA